MRASAVTRLVSICFHEGDGARYEHTVECFILGTRGTIFSLEGSGFYKGAPELIPDLMRQLNLTRIDGIVTKPHYVAIKRNLSKIGLLVTRGQSDFINGESMTWFEARL